MPPLGIKSYRIKSRYRRAYRNLEETIKDVVDECINELFLEKMPSGRRLKKMGGYSNPEIWEVRVTKGYRLTFHMDGTVAVLRNVGSHDMLNSP